ncbi:TonB-dependent receptor domain-containing protein [Pseudomonas chlororaphis]|uniref:TonB-dependent receptor domain-containing protein n=1 Tax=Pseudomonas chlororaphis TaxID=587753 RepID=UPI0006A614AB|nr:TonB-dependent receptor [Pseudomonas chlororaphis]AZD04726.1 Outer membrane vitamin B12 receptor BtuB [Pseudomonas chlororaphis subsp. chlororaphis]MBM0285782.1 TonB-dependent receptor [Pseudomonas chlororaphis]MDO1508204.1 TonB-dependent receptor [Pseudomonas chlororaphis]ORM47178.1 TonB-dependent receptor [Pseudomonas chlororaphis subsp. chlororaphis]TWR89507.1 TonB-dependent receptor [Pseudomonas chlororaphis subsp. chlororaphis]
MKASHLTLTLCLLPTGQLLADNLDREQALKLPDTLISANRQVEARNDSSAANTVFTRDDIDRLQPSSATDLLQRVPGAQVAQSGGRGSVPGIYIRGTSSAQTLVLVDGQRIGSSSSGDSNLQHLNIQQIERVEVLRGSRSVIYGSDAIGGVIQIFTRRSAEQGLQPRLHLGVGSHQSWERSIGLSGGDQQTRFSLGASLDDTAGSNRTHESYASDRDNDAYRNQSLSLSLSHAFNDDWEAGLNLLDNRGKSEFDNPFGRFDSRTFESLPQKPYSEFAVSSFSSYVDGRINDVWKSRLELGHSENREKTFDKLSDERTVFNTYRDSVNWQNDLTLDERNSLIVGGDWYQDRVNSSTAFAEDSRWNRAAFVQHRFKAESFSTELGLRRDQNQQFGGQNSWSGTLTLPLNADNDVLLTYSEGFRAPTFNDLYYPDFSNPDLKPETSKSYELQWRSQLSESTRLETSLYRTDLEDAIIFGSNSRPQNVASARINGFEATLQQELFGWQSNLGLAIIDPRDRDTGHTLARRARRTLSLDLDRQFDRLGLGASWQAVSSSYDDLANQQRLGGYALLGLRSSWALNREVRLELKVDNLLEKSYSRVLYSHDGAQYGYREQGRAWMFGVTWTPEL